MITFYLPGKEIEEFYSPDRDEYCEKKEDGLFHIGQSYEETVAKTIYCKNCGGKEFNVGSGNYFTAIRCVKCEWELCIHDG